MTQFRLPDVGEGLTEAEIVSWKVQPGDAVDVNDVLVEIETAKSLVELPCPAAGTVDRLLVHEGQTVEVGTPLVEIASAAPDEPDVGKNPDEPTAADEGGAPRESEREPVLVGYGPRPGRRRRRTPRAADEPARALHGAFSTGHEVGLPVAPPPPPHPVSPVAAHAAEQTLPPVGPFPQEEHLVAGDSSYEARVLAKPPVRRLARDLGVDLGEVAPTGAGGVVTRADVERHAQSATSAEAPATHLGWGGLPRTERVPVRSVRKATARAVVASAFTAPHVTQFVTIDVTASMELLERLRTDPAFADLRLSPLTLAARAVAQAARRTPEVNAAWDGDAGEVVLRRYVDLGIATATQRGLLVPVVRDADQLGLPALARQIADLADRAREGRTTPHETSGGTLSITNIGVFGMDAGTPIMPPGHSAILALGQVARRPWVVGDGATERIEARWVTTLALSFDHRLVDGAQGSAFVRDIAQTLSDPARAWATADGGV